MHTQYVISTTGLSAVWIVDLYILYILKYITVQGYIPVILQNISTEKYTFFNLGNECPLKKLGFSMKTFHLTNVRVIYKSPYKSRLQVNT